MQENLPAVVIEDRVDYLTASHMYYKALCATETERFRDVGLELVHQQEKQGNRIKRWSMHSFAGVHCGQINFGKSSSGYLIQISGELAGSEWKRVHQSATNVTRLDCAFTVKLLHQWRDLSWVHHDQIKRWAMLHSPRLRITRVDGGKHGNSLLVGSRVSDAYGRIYDKHAESKREEYRDCWRYEVEWKRAEAVCHAEALASMEMHQVTPGEMASSWFQARAIVPAGVSHPLARYRALRPATDDSRCLQWIATAVRGSALHLVRSGRLNELLCALGLSSIVMRREEHSVPRETYEAEEG